MTDISQELERLQKLRTELESRLAAIDDEHKTVEEDIRILREKVLIRELEKKMKEKGDIVAGLRIEKRELEDKIKEPKKFSEKKEPEDKMREPNKLSISEAILKAKAEMENKKDTVEKKEEPSSIFRKKDERTPERDEKPKEPEKKKKLGIF